MINNSKSLAKILSFLFDPTMEGKIVDARYIKAIDYEKYKAAQCVCLGCGAEMILAHRPHKPHNYYFRAATKHNDENCPYNKSNGNGGKQCTYGPDIDVTTKAILPIEYFFPHPKGGESNKGRKQKGPEDQGGTNKNGNSDGPNRIKKKEKKIKSLKVWYARACIAPLNMDINNSFSFGEFFIMCKTIEAGTIKDYTGLHIFVGRTCDYKKTMNILQNVGKYSSKNNMIIKCENNSSSYGTDLYVFLDFKTFELNRDFWNEISEFNAKNTKKEDLRILVINNFTLLHKERNTTILYAKIDSKVQFDIVKRCDDSE